MPNTGYAKLTNMIRKSTSSSGKRKVLAVIGLVLLLAIGIGAYINGRPSKEAKAPVYPQYFNFSGNYSYNVPKEYSVDEQSVPGIQLVYSGTFTVKTLEDLYNVGGISVQGLTGQTDHSGKAFKKYVDKEVMPGLKKDFTTSDVERKFAKVQGWDVARLTINKDGKALRFIYIKNGKHPVMMVANKETDPFKKIAQSLLDIEDNAFNSEVGPIKQSLQNIVQLAKEQKAQELYDVSTQALRTRNTKDDLAAALKASADYTNGNVAIAGGSYDSTKIFTAALRLVKLSKDDQRPAFGSLALKKVDGQWKLEMIGLPSTEQQQQP